MEDRLLDFLLRAKQNTYAAKAAESAPSRPNSHDLSYAEGDYLYLDTYLGGERFSGEEAVWLEGKPVWAMNYSGRVLDGRFNGDFLKHALLLVPSERPYRGPESYQEGDLSYACRVTGSPDWYQGYEEIRFGDALVYECFFHGGSVL